jgi:hypothetical protein
MNNHKIILSEDQIDLILELAKREADHQYYLMQNRITKNMAESFGKLGRSANLINSIILQKA